MLYSACASSMLYTIFVILVARGGLAESWASIGILFVIVPILTYGWQASKFFYSSGIASLQYHTLVVLSSQAGSG
jgi:hypothetical protein